MTMNVNDAPPEGWDIKKEHIDEPPNPASNPDNPDLKKKRSWKKPKDKPMRPLSAYNMFFQNQRERIVAGKTGDPTPEEIHQSVMKMLTSKTRGPKRRQDRISHGQISFGDLARTIAAKWKAIDPKLKAIYNHYAAQEKIRYKKEVVVWKEKKEREHDAARAAKQKGLLTSSSSYNDDSFMSMSSSATSMSTSMSTSHNLSESINSLQGSVGMQLYDADMVQRQQDILREQMGFIDSKPHARMDGNDSVSREIPKQQLGGSNGNDGGMQGMQFPPMGGNGNAINMHMNMNANGSLSRNASMLNQNLQMQLNHKEQLLLQLQHQQLQQLQQLQQARNETSRLSNIKTTDTFMNMQPSKMTGSDHRQFAATNLGQQGINSSAPKQLMDQFKELENITQELDRLKQQEIQTQQKIEEHQNQSNSAGLWQGNLGFGNAFNNGPQIVASGNFAGNEFTSNLNDTGPGNSSLQTTFDMEERQCAVRRSQSGDTNIYQGRVTGMIEMDGSASGDRDGQRRQHPMMGSGDGANGFSSAPSSFNDGRKGSREHNQQQQQSSQNEGRRDSLSALLHLDDMGGMGAGDQQRQQKQQQQQQQQEQQTSFAEFLHMQDARGNGGQNDLRSIFNMNMGGNT